MMDLTLDEARARTEWLLALVPLPEEALQRIERRANNGVRPTEVEARVTRVEQRL